MGVNGLWRMKNIWLRISVVLIVSIIIWHVIIYLNDMFLGEEYSRIHHLFLAVLTTILTIVLIEFACRIDKISWKQLGQASIRTNIFSFLLGFFLWTIPALIGILICSMLGWVDITVLTNFNDLLLNVLLLLIIVFLIEALPEELIFRGYIYRYLNIMFPHWVTLILQALLFSLFGYLIGSMYSVEQIQFIPGFAVILGIFRAISGNVWASIGFHVAIMTATQILSPVYQHFDVNGMLMLKFFAFILLPSMLGSIALGFIFPNHKWSHKNPL